MQEKGYTFNVDGIPQVRYGTISLVPADNLASILLWVGLRRDLLPTEVADIVSQQYLK